jgi:gas vesicle structural protein
MSLQSPNESIALVELLDRVIDKGVVLTGDVTLSVADVDLVYVGLRLLLSSVDTANRMQWSTADAPNALPDGTRGI